MHFNVEWAFLSACNIENEVLVDTLLNDKQHLNPEHLSEIIKKELESDSDGPSDLNLIQHGYNIARNSANPDVLKTLQKSSLLNVPQDEYAADLFLTACRSNDAQKIKEHLPEKEIPKEKVEEAFRNLFKSRESIEAVKALLDSGLTPPEDSLSTACNYHHIDKDLLKLMIEWRGKDGNERLLPLDIDIHNVCDSDNVDLLKLLIETKTGLSSKDDRGYSNSLGINARLGALPIEIACLNGNVEMVKVLTQDLGVRVTFLAMNTAIGAGNLEMTKALLQKDNAKYLVDGPLTDDLRPDYFKKNETDLYDYNSSIEDRVQLLVRTGSLEYFTSTETAALGENRSTTVGELRRSTFEQFPVLTDFLSKEMVSKKTTGVQLPEDLQKAIDTGNSKEVAKYFGTNTKTLSNIPLSNNSAMPTERILLMLKDGILRSDWLPTLPQGENKQLPYEQNPNDANKKWRTEQKAFCDVLGACVNLNEELHLSPEFLNQLIIKTASSSAKSWQDKLSALPKELVKKVPGQQSGVVDAIEDFGKTVFLPCEIQSNIDTYRPENAEEIWGKMRKDAISSFLKDVPIGAICELSTRWHEPGRVAQLNKVKTFSDNQWEPLISDEAKFIHEHQKGSITAVPLTNSSELTQEGKDLSHCVGGYTNACLRESSHIVSFRNEKGESLSTLELRIKPGQGHEGDNKIINIKEQEQYHLALVQHYGDHNASPASECKEAEGALFNAIREGALKVDLPALEQKKEKRVEVLKAKTDIVLIGYDPTKKESVQNATTVYRKDGIGDISSCDQIQTSFDTLTGGKKHEKNEESHAKRVGKKKKFATIDPVISIQESMDILLGKDNVIVHLDKSNPLKNKGNGEVIIEITKNSSLDESDLKAKLEESIGNPATISISDGCARIEGLAPMPVANKIKGGLSHTSKLDAQRGNEKGLEL